MDYIYSISIPHYNSPVLLRRMLKSIPEREDIQLIVVDDGSSEENVNALKKLQHKNLELVLLEENRGGGYARNIGLQHAKGKWFISVDADDYFSDGTFDVFDQYESDDIDCLFFCLNCVNHEGTISVNRTSIPNEAVKAYIKKACKKTETDLKFRNTTSWNKLVRLSFIKEYNICYEDCRVNIDVLFSFGIGLNMRRFKAINETLYNLVSEEGSITRKPRTIEREYLFYLQAQKRNGFYEAIGLKRLPYYRYDFLYIPFMIKKRGIRGAIEFFNYRKRHIEEVKKARKQYLSLLK